MADSRVAAALLLPELGGRLLTRPEAIHALRVRLALGMGASVMLGWTVLLLWANQKPRQGKGVLLMTVFPVLAGLEATTYTTVTSHFMNMAIGMVLWLFQGALFVLFSGCLLQKLGRSKQSTTPTQGAGDAARPRPDSSCFPEVRTEAWNGT